MFKKIMFKKRLKDITAGIVIGGIISTSLFGFASMQNISAFFNDIKIKINGEVVDVGADQPFIYNGRTYLPARYVAEGLGASVKWNETDNSVEIDSLGGNGDKVEESNGITGSVKGMVTWQYNDYIGTKPDVGANVALISKSLKPNISTDRFCSYLKTSIKHDGIFTSVTDGYGNYQIENVPVGEYYLMFVSDTVKNDFTVSKVSEFYLKPLFTSSGWDSLSRTLKSYKHEVKEIEILNGKTITQSVDFGNTYY